MTTYIATSRYNQINASWTFAGEGPQDSQGAFDIVEVISHD